MLTAAGSGYSRWRDLAVTRWREDVDAATRWGSYVFLRDARQRRGLVGRLPAERRRARQLRGRVLRGSRRDRPARRHASRRRSRSRSRPRTTPRCAACRSRTSAAASREIELTSYAEIVLAPPAADAAHPAFSKLFVQTEFVADVGALLATRRPRSPGEPEVWAAHLAVVEGETRRAACSSRPTARASSAAAAASATPISVIDGRPLSEHRRRRARSDLQPAPPRAAPAGRHGARRVLDAGRAVARARRSTSPTSTTTRPPSSARSRWPGRRRRSQLHHLGVEPDEAHLFQRLANHVLYSDPTLRPAVRGAAARNAAAPSALWAHGISGDLPIVLVRIDDAEDLRDRPPAAARPRVLAHEAARRRSRDPERAGRRPTRRTSRPRSRRWCARASRGPAPTATARAAASSSCAPTWSRAESRAVLQTRRARGAAQPPRQPRRAGRARSSEPRARRRAAAERAAPPRERREAAPPRPELEFFNGLGGFAAGGREYVTILGEGQWTPAPWINVIANPALRLPGLGRGRRLHLVGQQPREPAHALVERSRRRPPGRGRSTCATRTAARSGARPRCRSARRPGPTSRATARATAASSTPSHGIALELLQFVPLGRPDQDLAPDDPRIAPARSRRLSVTAYVEWVLGASRGAAAPFVVTELDAETGALLARNPWSTEFGERVAFADLGGRQLAWTGDRTEFLGRNGALDRPAALARRRAALEPRRRRPRSLRRAADARRAARRTQRAEIVFLLGEAATTAEARALIARYRARRPRRGPRARSTQRWDDVLGAVQVTTPDRSLDLLLNRWLLYQTLACRVWARSAFYQASGAYGFRDQLQDVHGARASRAGRSRASTCCAPPRGSSSRATCSTGGCRRRATACARASPTTASGCPTPPRTTSRSPAIARCSTRRVPFLEGPPLRERRARRLLPARCVAERARDALRALRARARPQPRASAPTACR